MENVKRKDKHSGSWYPKDAATLKTQLETFKNNIQSVPTVSKAIITPHAGYEYSGQTAAYAYASVDFTNVSRVFVLGPSHFKYFIGAGLTPATSITTPLGEIAVDTDVIKEISTFEFFNYISITEDEKEHSIQMQMPFLQFMSQGAEFKVVPIVVGTLSNNSLESLINALLPYFEEDDNLFVISSDFCHWGENFSYTLGEEEENIEAFVRELDKKGIEAIQSLDLKKFQDYVEETDNTICGLHPIEVLLNLVENSGMKLKATLLNYSKSEEITSTKSNSVSYAAIAFDRIE